jgi:signal transduction histidine kinase/ActR/RegA family two-component response regulator
MNDQDLHLGGPTASMARRLEAAGALVHALVHPLVHPLGQPLGHALGHPPDAGRAEDAGAAALLEELALPVAVFEAARRAPRLANGAWRALHGDGGAAYLHGHVDEVIRTGAAIHLAEVALPPDDGVARCAAMLRPLGDHGGGGTTGAIVVCALITDAVIARELGVGADALVWGGPGGEAPDYFNRAWCAYTGWSCAEAGSRLSALPWQEAIHAADRPGCVQALGEVGGRGAADLVARVRQADGGYRRHRIRFETAARRWFGVAVDVEAACAEAERAELLACEQRARAEAEQSSQLKERFLAVVSHELRTPLTTMLLWEKTLRDESADAALRAQALEAIHQSAMSQSRLVEDLLDVSRAISGKLHVDLRPLEIERVLSAALDAIAPAADAKGIELVRRGGPVASEVLGDCIRLRQVLDNLLANAVKFTDLYGQITVGVTREAGTVAITIADTGCGIAPEALARLFVPFTQLDASLTRANDGLGLGLAIAKQIAAIHHGELTAASAGVGCGATFTLRLRQAEPVRAGAPATRVTRAPSLGGNRILVVDDDRYGREALTTLLERIGASVDAAESAQSARVRILRNAPDVILCDIAMPGEDGHRFLRRLRASGANIPAIALTAHAMEKDAESAIAAGFDLYMAKPIDFDRLVEAIAELIADRRPELLEQRG